jgi:hypothetical protein
VSLLVIAAFRCVYSINGLNEVINEWVLPRMTDNFDILQSSRHIYDLHNFLKWLIFEHHGTGNKKDPGFVWRGCEALLEGD